MTSFSDREKSFEKKFAMDEELKFKAGSAPQQDAGAVGGREARAVGSGGGRLRQGGAQGRPAEKGDEDVFRKIRKDLDDKGVRVSDAELRKAMADFLHTALEQIEGEGKTKSS